MCSLSGNRLTNNRKQAMRKNTIRTFKNGNTRSTIEHFRKVHKNLGIRCAAGMMRNKGMSLEAALYVLLGK